MQRRIVTDRGRRGNAERRKLERKSCGNRKKNRSGQGGKRMKRVYSRWKDRVSEGRWRPV